MAHWRSKLPDNLPKPWIFYLHSDKEKFGTVAVITYKGISYIGISLCFAGDGNRKGDMFNRKIGRNIAIGRAEKALSSGKTEMDNEFHRNPTYHLGFISKPEHLKDVICSRLFAAGIREYKSVPQFIPKSYDPPSDTSLEATGI